MTKEERAALIIGGWDVIEAEIFRLARLRITMVGTLYPAIVTGQIADLRALQDQVGR